MTTVGYGDRVPKSVPARLLSVFWILCGMTICALLTAAITTAIVSVADSQKPSINKGTIGIVKDRAFEKFILMKGNAHKLYLPNVTELSSAVRNGKIDGMLLDLHTAKYQSAFVDEELFVESIVADLDQSYLGLTVYDSDLYGLLSEYIEFHRDYINDFIFDTFQSMEELNSPVITSNLIFTTKSGMFRPILYTCLVLLVGSLLIGGLYELYQLGERRKLRRVRVENQFTLKSLKREEKQLQEELALLLKQWDKHLLTLMRVYTVEGRFKKSSTTFPDILLKLSPYKLEKDYEPDNLLIGEKGSKTPTPTKQPNVKKKMKKSIRQIEPLNTTEDGPNGYIKIRYLEGDRRKNSPLVASKLKKKNLGSKAKKNKNRKSKKKLIDIDEDTSPYGTYTNNTEAEDALSTLKNTRRLPPLNKNENIV